MTILLDNHRLEKSSVVSNSTMNRERGVVGPNSYAKDLAFNPLEFLETLLGNQTQAAWLDLCCGSGRALVEASEHFERNGEADRVSIAGVDLVGYFQPVSKKSNSVQLVEASLSDWEPTQQFDLITCVHGLHYIGDKLSLLSRAASWITAGGLLIAHLDFANLRISGDANGSTAIRKSLRKSGFEYDSRRHIIRVQGRRTVDLPYRYVGSDDKAGPNFTGQPVVDSYYE